MPTKPHKNRKKEALDALQERETEEIYLRSGQKRQEMGEEVHPTLQEEEMISDNEFSHDMEYMPSMDYAYARALQLGCKERKEQFWHKKYDTIEKNGTNSGIPDRDDMGHSGNP